MNVFKKRSDLSLPPLPKPPTNEQMIQDIMASEMNDPLYLEELCKQMTENHTSVDLNYETVKKFIQTRQKVNDLRRELSQQLTEVQSSRDKLEEMAETIKKQAEL